MVCLMPVLFSAVNFVEERYGMGGNYNTLKDPFGDGEGQVNKCVLQREDCT
jgi:hypothetical protein